MKTKSIIAVASLLHDIGKLGWRAGEKGAHEEIGSKLIRQLVQNYEEIPSEVASFVSMHHESDLFSKEGFKDLKKIVIADWLASSERIGKEQQEPTRDIGLIPIFSKISIHNSRLEHDSSNYYYPAKELVFEERQDEIFPQQANIVRTSLKQNFLANWNSFKEKIERIKEYAHSEEYLFEFLYSLLKNNFKFIPSAAYKTEPDISLFDHSKMVCAFAIALNNYYEFNEIDDNRIIEDLNQIGLLLKELYVKGDVYLKEIEAEETRHKIFTKNHYFSLIHGDFSGVQNLIHTISSKYAMKTLKGRSFFISLLTEAVARYIVQQLDLTIANIIYAGGGHFYILGYNYDNLEDKIKEISRKANKILIDQFNANLYLALDFIPLSINDIVFDISKIWQKVNMKTSIKKKKKFEEVLQESGADYHSHIFGPAKGSANELQRCIICNSYKKLERIVEGELDENWCQQCRSFKDLTVKLKTGKYFRITKENQENYNEILNKFENAINFAEIVQKDQNLWFSINKPLEKGTLGTVLLPIAFPIYQSGLNKGDIINTDDLAEKAKERTGFNKIGILKMDVDSLGKIISRGLGRNNTISRVSTLSSSLDLFFKGYISKLIQSEFSDSVYLIFSGGDDLFAMGSWDKIIEFAFKLYKDFRRFTAFNKDITISAGIVIENPRFPIIKSAISSEEALDNAKTYEQPSPERNTKNKISLFGSVLSWDWSLEKQNEYSEIVKSGKKFEKNLRERIINLMKSEDNEQIAKEISNLINKRSEFELALMLKDILVYLIENKNFSNSMLQKIDSSVRGMKFLLEESLERKLRVPKLWRLKYYLRTVLRSKDDEVKLLINFIIDLFELIVKNNLFQPDSNLQIKNVEFISVAVKWADYLTRK